MRALFKAWRFLPYSRFNSAVAVVGNVSSHGAEHAFVQPRLYRCTAASLTGQALPYNADSSRQYILVYCCGSYHGSVPAAAPVSENMDDIPRSRAGATVYDCVLMHAWREFFHSLTLADMAYWTGTYLVDGQCTQVSNSVLSFSKSRLSIMKDLHLAVV